MIKVYKHNPEFKPEAPFMSDEAMVEMFDGRPILNVDILFIDRKAKCVLLPKRIAKPAEGLWFVGGMVKRSMPPLDMAVKIVLSETGTVIDPEQLEYVNASWFEWDYRKDAPSENGRVDFNLCYAYEPTGAEIESISNKLTDKEYDTTHGLKPYSRAELILALKGESACKQAIVDYFDQLFPS